MKNDPDRPTAVYRLLNEQRTLIYVGISYDPPRRLTEHRMLRPWAAEIAHSIIEWYDTRREAERVELFLIENEFPVHNIIGTPLHAAALRIASVRGGPPKHMAVVDDLTIRIAIGDIPEGCRIPTARVLAKQFRVSRTSVDRGMLLLSDRRLVAGQAGVRRWVPEGAQDLAAKRLVDDVEDERFYAR